MAEHAETPLRQILQKINLLTTALTQPPKNEQSSANVSSTNLSTLLNRIHQFVGKISTNGETTTSDNPEKSKDTEHGEYEPMADTPVDDDITNEQDYDDGEESGNEGVIDNTQNTSMSTKTSTIKNASLTVTTIEVSPDGSKSQDTTNIP
jgi:hypothetical protein